MSKTIAPVTESDYLKAYRIMLTSRVLEEKLASLYRAGMIKGGVFLGRGQEALSTATGIHLHAARTGPIQIVARHLAFHPAERRRLQGGIVA